jgi:hypothetical protein
LAAFGGERVHGGAGAALDHFLARLAERGQLGMSPVGQGGTIWSLP